jgi:hypothetical protein
MYINRFQTKTKVKRGVPAVENDGTPGGPISSWREIPGDAGSGLTLER